jgi:uncharacterized membrane protein
MLIPLPLGMFLSTPIFDIVYLLTDDLQYATVSSFIAVLGAVGGVAAAATGAFHYKNIAKGTHAKHVGTVHVIGNDIAIHLFALSAFLRSPQRRHLPDLAPGPCPARARRAEWVDRGVIHRDPAQARSAQRHHRD